MHKSIEDNIQDMPSHQTELKNRKWKSKTNYIQVKVYHNTCTFSEKSVVFDQHKWKSNNKGICSLNMPEHDFWTGVWQILC